MGTIVSGDFFSPTRNAALVAGPSPEQEAEFWRLTQKSPGCWLWMGKLTQRGYGVTRCGRRHVLAHRLAYRLATGVSPGSALVCHSCDIPQCVNPAHLSLGTHKTNLADAAEKGRMAKVLVESDVLEILRLYGEGHSIASLAQTYGIAKNSIYAILKRKCWHRVMETAERAGFFSVPSQSLIQTERQIPTLSGFDGKPRETTAIDRVIVDRIFARRSLLRITQLGLANAIGVSPQQVNKYEKGLNRITASRLFQIAHALGVSVSFFFDDIDPQNARLDQKSALTSLTRG